MNSENDDNKPDNKDIEIVAGNGSDINFSAVYEHLNAVRPKTNCRNERKKEIIIPEVKKKKTS
ncbi:MAG: hypothetical protein FWC53_02050 [Firmicutes bacterium]|nr:hypothetical protein [Bacillota bacterium]